MLSILTKKLKKKSLKLILTKMQKKLNKIAQDTNLFLKRFISKQKKSELIIPMKYGLFSGGKKSDQKF